MTSEMLEYLQKASKSGEIVKIIYDGGSQPGAVREVSPVSISEYDMKARDIATGIVKTFLLLKIRFPDSNSNAPKYDPNSPPFPNVKIKQTISETLTSKVAEIESLGWKVYIQQDGISVHRYFKNGKPRKLPDVSLVYNEFTYDVYVDGDSDKIIEEERKSTRPYRVDSPSFETGRTFSDLSNAIILFLNKVKLLAPKNAP
jgi:hypothetical protein